MTATGHALIGTVIASQFANPFLAIPLAFASHILADLTPHWDAGTHGKEKTKHQLKHEAAADVLLGFIASYLLIIYVFPETDLIYAFIMIITAQGMDWLSAPYYFFNIRMQPFKFICHISDITNTRLDKPWGIVTQVVIVGLLIYLGIIL